MKVLIPAALLCCLLSPMVRAQTTLPAPTRKPHLTPAAGQTLELSVDELGDFNYDPQKNQGIPDDVKRLDGAKVRLHGFMIPIGEAEKIRQFVLLASIPACMYCQPPRIEQTVFVDMPPGKSISYCGDPIIVEGTLQVAEKKDEGYVVSLFTVQAKSVTPAPPTHR